MAEVVEGTEPLMTPTPGRARPGAAGAVALLAALAWVVVGSASATAAEPAEGEALFRAGKYDECAALASAEIAQVDWLEAWHVLKIRSELARGKAKEAEASLGRAVRRFPLSLTLRLLARDVHRSIGEEDEAANDLAVAERLIFGAPERFVSPESRVAVGRFFLARGADARKVLDQFYDVARKQRPDFAEAYLATAELAIEKQDYALAADTLGKAPKSAAEDPRFHYLTARAYASDDHKRSAEALEEALKLNPRHVDSLLLRADQYVDGERYAEAARAIDSALGVNVGEPRAWAYRAVLAHLKNDAEGEAEARKSALEGWASNPEVDHLIGRKLSQKYRFAEGSAYQRKALELGHDYQPARVQLCQDLLRLGDESEGWKLADEAFARDGYDVVAYNLVTLRDRLDGFRTLKGDGLVVRMEPREADLYGDRVLALLSKARDELSASYGVTPPETVVVEVFPQRKEFAVRTFGLPGADGLLGVCFGRVVTALSPAAQGESPSNWESVLWHEFCHVLTLTKTRNKMPRWLSEGISVHEEKRKNPAWATPLSPKFRAKLLDEKLTPLSRLSAAFLTAETSLDVQFAYFESALAVDFLVERIGRPALNGLLDDLGAGKTIDEALPVRSKTTLEELDKDFARFARARAEAVAPGATWDEVGLPPDADAEALSAYVEAHPKSFEGLRRLGAKLAADGAWSRAKTVLESLKTLYPEYVGPENAYVQLAQVYRRTSDPAAEHAALEELAARDGSAGPAYQRLAELDESKSDWKGVSENARRLLAVNPLTPAPHRWLARASEKLGRRDEALAAYKALSLLDETDPAGVHFHLARLLKEAGRPAEARREVLKSLENAPRFLDAHRLLLDLVGSDPTGRTSEPTRPPTEGSQR